MNSVMRVLLAVLILLSAITLASAATVKLVAPDSVKPGDEFNVDFTVVDGTAKSVLINVTFDPAKVSYVSSTTYNLFDFTEKVLSNANYVKFLGVSTTGVDISTETKVATVTFKASETLTAGETINLNIVLANVDGASADTVNATITVAAAATPTPTPTPTPKTYSGVDVIFEDKTNPDVPIEVTIKDVDVDMATYTMSLDYGDVLKFTVDVPEKATIKLVDLETGEAIWTEQITGYKEFELDTVGLGIKPSKYTLKISASYGGETNDFNMNDATTYTKVTVGTDVYTPVNFVLEVKPKEVEKPVVEIELKNPTNEIAKGDLVKFEIKIYGATQGTWTLEGPFNNTEYKDKVFTVEDHKYTLKIYTSDILLNWDGRTGAYKLKVKSGETEKTYEFKIVGLSISVNVDKEEIKLGQKLKVYGVTNVAESGGSYDVGDRNTVTIYVYNSTTAEDKYLVTTKTVDVEEDGTFEKKIKFELGWDTGTYKIKAVVTTGYGFTEDASVTVEVKKPDLKITMDKLSYARGEDIKIKGETSLPAGTEVIVEGLDDFTNAPEKVKALVDTEGKFETKKYYVKSDAALSTYTVKAYIYKPGTTEKLVEDSVSIKVVRQSLEATIDKTVVAKGGKVKIDGTTTVDVVYIYADESDVFEGVAELPFESKAFKVADYPTKAVDVSDNKFETTLTVLTTADAGMYTLYVFAPADPNRIDPVSDAQKIFSVQVTEVGFTNVPETVTMVRGQDVDVKVYVTAPEPEDVYVKWSFKGYGIETKAERKDPTSEGVVKITLYPFYNDTTETLVSEGSPGELLATGVYTLTLKLYWEATDEEIEEARTKIPVEVISPELEVSIPEYVVKGDQLKVTINTNRAEGYDGIYVILKAPMKKYIQQVYTDENGTAIATFETAGLDLGEYKVYVRDTMKTIKSGYAVGDFYDVDPTEAYAKNYWAQDDILVIKKVEIVSAPPTTPTTTPATTPTTPVTTPTTTPTTPATTPTTPVTTPTTPTGPTPGFEAIFAIAGLLAVAYLLRRK